MIELSRSLDTCTEEIPYRELTVLDLEVAIPEHFEGLEKTRFSIAQRPYVTGAHQALVFFPAFGRSVDQYGVDQIFWNESKRYDTLLKHDTVNYNTTPEFLLWQHHAVLRELHADVINFLGVSLGGLTAIQMLNYLAQQVDTSLLSKCRKTVTVCSPATGDDLTLKMQKVLDICNSVLSHKQGATDLPLNIKILEKTLGAILRASAFEAETMEELREIFAYTALLFQRSADLKVGMFKNEIVSLGVRDDAMVANARMDRFSNNSRFRPVSGIHSPFISIKSMGICSDENKKMMLEELG